MKKILFILCVFLSPIFVQSQDVPARRARIDTMKVFSTNYGTLDTVHHKSREWFYRPIRFDSAVTFGVRIDSSYLHRDVIYKKDTSTFRTASDLRYVKFADTLAMLNNRFARDTVSLSNRINAISSGYSSADSSYYVTKSTRQTINTPKDVTARWYMTSVAVDTVLGKSKDTVFFPTSLVYFNNATHHRGDSTLFQRIDGISDSTTGSGTASVAFASSTITGSGTAFLSELTAGGSITFSNGLTFPVISIASDVSATTSFYTGTAVSGLTYKIYGKKYATIKYSNGILLAEEGSWTVPYRDKNYSAFVVNPTTSSFQLGRGTGTEWDSASTGSYTFNIGANSTVTSNYSSAFNGVNNKVTSIYSGIFGHTDSILSTSGTGQNYIFGNNNTIGRQNPSGTYGNFLNGQYLRSENLGLWAFGADDSFEKKIIPFEGAMVFVNEAFTHWYSNSMGLLGYQDFGFQTPHVKDSIRFNFRYQKHGDASDAVGNGAIHFEGRRNFNAVTGSNYKIGVGSTQTRYFSVNENDDNAWHFNSSNTSGKPFGNIYADSGHFIVSAGYVDADSFKLNGTTFLSTTTDIGIAYIDTTAGDIATKLGNIFVGNQYITGNVSATGAGSFGALSGTSYTGTLWGSFGDSIKVGNDVYIGGGGTSQIEFTGSNATQRGGTQQIFQASGGLFISARGNVTIGIDNDDNATTSAFNVLSNGTSGTTLLSINENVSATHRIKATNNAPLIAAFERFGSTTAVASIDTIGKGTFTAVVATDSLRIGASLTTEITSGKFTKVAGGSTVADGVVSTPDTIVWTAQTASLASQNFANTATGHLYRVSYYLHTTTTGTGTVLVTLSWNDGTAKTSASATADLTSTTNTGLATGSQIIYVSSGTPSWTTTVAGGGSTEQYALRMVLERLY